MAKFAIAPEKQAASVIKSLQGREIKSVRTANNFESALNIEEDALLLKC